LPLVPEKNVVKTSISVEDLRHS